VTEPRASARRSRAGAVSPQGGRVWYDVWVNVWIEASPMPTNLSIDDGLLELARKLGGHRTKKETVNEALREYVQRRRSLRALRLFGRIHYDPAYDYKRQRGRA
jgi:Arc/MetJ family transcription regulator